MRGFRLWSWVAAVTLFLWCLGDLLSPGAVLLDRDLSVFHWPLRAALESAAALGVVPEWNSSINGGQPVLSNPNYAAFYPPTWLLLLVSSRYSINLLILLHAAWSILGCRWLLRRLGAESPACLIGAVGFGLSPWFLGLSSTLNFYCGMAWWPWVIGMGLKALGPGGAPARRRASILTAVGLAIQLMAGEPVTVLISALALIALAVGRKRNPVAGLAHLALIGTLSTLFAAVLLLPTAHRVADSSRGEEEVAASTTAWSLPPVRIAEIVIPRIWGDPMRDEEGVYFGWTIHDRAFPYVLSLYIGIVLLLPGLAALSSKTLHLPIPYRRGWLLMVALGIALALGRHFPLLGETYGSLPLLGLIRYPEKFVVLALAALSIAGGLALDAMIKRRARSRTPERLAFTLAAIHGVMALFWWSADDAAETLVRRLGDGFSDPAIGVVFLRREAVVGLLLSLALGGLLRWLHGRPAPSATRPSQPSPGGLPALLFLTLLCLDLAYYSASLFPTLPHQEALVPPTFLATLPPGSRVVTTTDLVEDPPHLAIGPPRFQQSLGRIRQLDPYVGNLWGVSYVLNPDFDLMSTSWATHAREQFIALQEHPREQRRLAGAWNATASINPKTRDEIRQEFSATGTLPSESKAVPVRERLPWARSVASVSLFPSADAANSWLQSVNYDVRKTDGCIATESVSPLREGGPTHFGNAELEVIEERGSSVTLEYRTAEDAYLVLAMTYDSGWKIRIDEDLAVAPCPTALGQIGLAVPPGTHRVTLRYKDPWVGLGAWVSILTLLAVGAMEFRTLRRSTA